MMQSFCAAKMGLKAQQIRIDTIANNVANVNTYGFKSSSVNFKDTLYTKMLNPVETEEDLNLNRGTGVMVSSTVRSFAEGTPIETGVALDMRIEGDGFFTISGQEGENYYTRSGAFAVSVEDDGNYLVNAQGDYVLDTNLNKIVLPGNSDDLSVNSAGEIYIDDTYVATLNIADFVNKDGLSAIGNGYYAETEASGQPVAAQDAIVHQGSLESSNVDLGLEMTRLIRAQRAFSLVSKALTTSDEMARQAANMR
jgi:flagellar basal-body rod protein FlgG